MMFDFRYTRGLSYARGTSIDPYLSEEDRKALYEKWDNAWGHPNEFPGGQTDITCEMVLDAPEASFVKLLGKERGPRILKIARTYGG